MNIRFNAKIVSVETGEEREENYLMYGQVLKLLRNMKEGDAMVLNAVAGPEAGEL